MYEVNDGPSDGPSDDAWGVALCDPVIVTHQGRLMLFARARGAAVGTLYFRVLDPAAAVTIDANDDLAAWNGWYRHRFPEALATLPQNAEDAAARPARELRLAGMDLLTVTPAAVAVAAADAAFRVTSDGVFLSVFRQSAAGTLLLDRLGVIARSEEIDGRRVDRFALEPAWEVRFRRSRVRDVPLDDVDGESYLDPTGEPFDEPAIEFARIDGLRDGAYDVAQVPTADAEVGMLYAAVVMPNGVQLHQVRRSATSLTDYTETAAAYPLIAPTLRAGGAALAPIAGLAPALAFYAEQEAASTADGDAAELQRAGHLMLAIPVAGGGLTAAVAVYDFALDRDGNVAVLPAAAQSLVLVDGTLHGNAFVPDTTSPAFPTPVDLPDTVQMVDGLLVSTMVLGQPQPTRSPVLVAGDDGLVHLYLGGPLPAPPFDRWGALDPDLPQAMVAQFDARANRLVISAPWTMTEAEEQPDGAVEFVALQSGCIMEGATVAVSDGALMPDGAAAPDLCDVTIVYPAASGLPAERWTAVPRSLGPFMDVLNGQASSDAADPRVLAGTTPFFDHGGTRALARAALAMPDGVPNGMPPVATFVSARPDVALASVDVAPNTPDTIDVTLSFAAPARGGAHVDLVVHWRAVPRDVATYADVFAGAAAPPTYAYPADADGTPLFALPTDAVGVPAPVLLYALGTNDVAGLTIAVQPAGAERVDVAFVADGTSVVVPNVPADVARFVAALEADAGFLALGLGVSGATAAGRVRPTPAPVGRVGLAATAALFDVLLPAIDLAGAALAEGRAVAGVQGHAFTPPLPLDATRMVGFLARSVRPAAGATAYVRNTPAGAAVRSASRTLVAPSEPDAHAPLVSGVWRRAAVQQQCAFTGTDAVTVPVAVNGAVVPASINLRPQWDWTVEAWVRPEGGDRQRLLTFVDGVTAVPAGAPRLAYALALDSQNVVRGGRYAKEPGTPDSSYFQTGITAAAGFMPARAFTWEWWIKPDAQAAPPGSGGDTPLGGVIQIGEPRRTACLTVGLTADRHVHVVTLDQDSNPHVWRSADVVPDVDDEGVATWSHLALVGTQDTGTGRWTLALLIDARLTSTFADVEIQEQPSAFLVIGADTPDDATLFGCLAQLRYWSIARSAAEIRRTWFASLSGTEPGLLGNWPLGGIEAGGPTEKFVRNTAAITGTAWDAPLFDNEHQPIGTERDAFFLSAVASVGGLAAVEADALLANGRWNHLALVYRAGGALAMNGHEWATCGHADALGPSGSFAIDAFVRLPQLAQPTEAPLGTIMARWAPNDDPDAQCFVYWVDGDGEMRLAVAIVVDDRGTVAVKTARSTGAALADGATHHVAVSFGTSRAPGDHVAARWAMTFYRDGVAVGTTSETIDGLATIAVRTGQNDVTIGAAFGPVPGSAPMAPGAFFYLRGALGELRFWTTAASPEALFPERYVRVPQAGAPGGLAARWSFREQAGRTAFDTVGGNDATLSSSGMWASLAATSTLAFVANGAVVGGVRPASLEAVATSQFAIGRPAGAPSVAGFTGAVAQVALYDEARSVDAIRDQMYVPRWGDESRLVACWTFSDGGADITGGRNDASPPVAPGRLGPSTAPMSDEGPSVRNVYGGPVTDLVESTPGRLAVGSYAAARDAGTPRQRGVLARQYVLDPDRAPPRAIQVGALDLTYVGQVQTDPTLIGYIEGAPPVPSENLTRPYYLDPGNPAYMRYMNTAQVTLVQEASETMTFASSSAHATQIEASAAFGVLGMSQKLDVVANALPFSFATNAFNTRAVVQAAATGVGSLGGGAGQSGQGAWGATQRDQMSVNGDWEPYQRDPSRYLDPVVGRRFVVDNTGYAIVESLTADLYAITFRPTKAALGTMVIPNPAIPPDRNVVIFPMNGRYTKNGTLDGKVGLVNDPDYPDADARRGSLFRPVEAHALAARIERERQRSQGLSAQFDPERRARAWNTSLDAVKGALPQDFSRTPADPVAVATPVQGLANRYVWTADGGFHAETQRTAATSVRSYAGNVMRGGGGGFRGEGEFFAKLGFAWSFDVMATHRVDVQVTKDASSEQALSLDVSVEGEAFLRAFDPALPPEYGALPGAFRPGSAPGKVRTYRFMTIYLPPSSRNGGDFAAIVDPMWLRLSNDPGARALRALDRRSPTWRVLHRVTYVERVPPPIASRPVFTPARAITTPANVEGNAELIRLVDAQIPPGVRERTRLVVGNAVAVALDPAPTSPGVYPRSVLEASVSWWRAFLDRARPGPPGSAPPDPAAAALLQRLVARTTAYLHDGYASDAFAGIIDR